MIVKMNKRPGVSQQQRTAMSEFMLHHADFARGRVVGPDAVRRRVALTEEIAEILNAIDVGATKTPEKWWKYWQDWRSNIKAKALSLKKYSKGTGDGPGPSPLTELEDNLLQLCGLEILNEVDGVQNSLELVEESQRLETEAPSPTLTVPSTPASPLDIEVEVEKEPVNPARRQRKNDHLEKALERRAAATEHLAVALERLSENLSNAILTLATALQGRINIIQKDSL